MKYTNFKNFVLRTLEKNYSRYYESYEDFMNDMENGDVTVPIQYMFELHKQFEEQLNKPVEFFSKEEQAQIAEDFMKSEIDRLTKEIDAKIAGTTTGSSLIDYLTR